MNPLKRVAQLFGYMEPSEKKAARTLYGVDDRGWTNIFTGDATIGSWQRDEEWTRDTVVAQWTVFSCMTLIASDIGKCCIRLVEKEDDIWEESDNPAFSPVLRKPNRYQTRQQFMESWILSKLSWGNTYVLKERDARNVVVAEYILDPCRVRPLISESGDVYYQLMIDDLKGVREDMPAVPASEIIHDRFNCIFHQLVGLSPIYASGLAATQGLRIQRNSSKFFENMSRPSGILTAPGAISADTAARLKSNWEANYTGTNNIGKVAVLGDGLKYESMGVTAADSQMVEQMRLTAEMICATFHVPAFKIGAGTIPAGQKVEDLNQIYYSDCLHSLMDAVQTLQTEGLGLDGISRAVQFDLDDLLKMDTATFVSTIKMAIDAAVMSPNEGRKKLNLPPVDGGDAPLSQQQNWSLAQLADRGAIPDASTVAAPPPPDPNAADSETMAFTYALMKGLAELEHA